MVGNLLQFYNMRKSPRLSAAALDALQLQKLRAVVDHAYNNVPYYRSLFQSAGVSPQDIRCLADLRRIPISSKADLLDAGPENITARGMDPGSLAEIRTSGTTGTPFTFRVTRTEQKLRGIIELRDLMEIGLRPWDRMVTLGPIGPYRKRLYQRFGLFRFDRIEPILPMAEQVRRLKSLNPTVLRVFPTALRALLESVDYPLSKLCRPRMLVTSAEMFRPVMKDADHGIDFDLEHFNFYGSMEGGRIAGECEMHEGLHVCADNMIVDIEPLEDQPAVDGDPNIGEVVITTLNNQATPFIRYRLGDLVRNLEKPCACGRSFPLISAPIGRTYDLIRLPSGRVLSPYGMLHFIREFHKLRRYRITQESPGRFVVEIVVRETPTKAELDTLASNLRGHLAEPVELEIRTVDAIETHGRKFKVFVSKLC